jgi:phytoene synthase
MRKTLILHPDDRRACRGWIRTHSKSFYLSSLLLPARVRESAWALYAFCRRADDAVDEVGGPGEALRRVDSLRSRLDAVYHNTALDHPIDRSFAQVAAHYQIQRSLPEALLSGMEMDARGVRYETDEDLLLYCFRVAATVGLMMTKVMGASTDVAYLRAADLGIAMQLTNIARDIGEDARRGRVYLPETLCEELQIDRLSLERAESASFAVRQAVKRLLLRAEAHYLAADRGVPLLPRSCRLAIASSRLIYSGIGRALARIDYDSVRKRAYVPLGQKLLLVARASAVLWLHGGRHSLEAGGPADGQLRPLLATTGIVV